ncbi:hypothetical protein [Mycolicibacterium sp. 120270]|uniref:hypothetical protein n=1 Tax=Mycolicibacterium sp. 120270 TaxID=3090600 RepID=UPI00299E87F9|nr:hypothetical protein [Mycolicibacterium sp. 120270]MDX1883108.1 hypothetical protein [Mycolicibacterium sp. 120270]
MSTSTGKKLCGATTAAMAIGLLITPAPAQAGPDCYGEAAGYQFAGGEVTLNYPEVGAHTTFNAPRGTTVDAPAETFYPNGTSMKGRVTGEIDKGGNWIKLTVTRGKYAPLLLTGAVQPPGNKPSGALTFENHDMQPWDSPNQLICIPGAPIEERPLPKPAAPPEPAPEPVAQQAPPPENPPPTEAQAPPPEEAAAPPPEQNQPCIPDPFDLNFPGAC